MERRVGGWDWFSANVVVVFVVYSSSMDEKPEQKAELNDRQTLRRGRQRSSKRMIRRVKTKLKNKCFKYLQQLIQIPNVPSSVLKRVSLFQVRESSNRQQVITSSSR